jgi:hypothetical protein
VRKSSKNQSFAFRFGWRYILVTIVIAFVVGVSGCSQKQVSLTPTATEEPAIPANYVTYTDESGLFSISYPPEWDVDQSRLADIEQAVKDYIKSIDSNIPVEKASILFMAGKKVGEAYMPSVNIAVEPVPQGVHTNDQLVEAELKGVKAVVEDYVQVSRIKTTVGGREATILDHEYTLPSMGRFHLLQMIILTDKAAWTVTCGSFPEDFSKWEKDFQSIVRSLRILK